jgi:hypothetical protein
MHERDTLSVGALPKGAGHFRDCSTTKPMEILCIYLILGSNTFREAAIPSFFIFYMIYLFAHLPLVRSVLLTDKPEISRFVPVLPHFLFDLRFWDCFILSLDRSH